MTVAGMGDPQEGSTTEWARILFPDGVLESSGDRRWLARPGGDRIYLVEALYEDINTLANDKFAPIWDLIPDDIPDGGVTAFRESFGDVCTNVIVGEVLATTRQRFIECYAKAIQIAIDISFPNDFRDIKFGVLCHSLGTYVTYEGLHSIYSAPFVVQYLPTRVVFCAPMLRPICQSQEIAVASQLMAPTHLTTQKCRRPRRTTALGLSESFVDRTLFIHNKSDPFYAIHHHAWYRHTENRDLVDEFRTIDSDPGIRFWNGHNMGDVYLQLNRAHIVEVLFS